MKHDKDIRSLPDMKTDFPDWYNHLAYRDLADQAPVRGCIVMRPYGCSLWENITAVLDKKIKETGHQNAIFPLLIPQSFLSKEAQHVEGFSPELAVVTHAGGKELEEPLVVRPTSETIIHAMFARWITSWRDLPLKINQWANVVRWEMRTRPFLRTTEFWWQEGHTAHETYEEACDEVMTMLNEYVDVAQNYLAIPVVAGRKSDSERFAGADMTWTIEGLMQDGKALQMGTSHLISQSFAKAFGIMFQDRSGTQAYPYLTSWGMTTRLIGAIIMTHGDQRGLILPPKVAPIQLVIIPIFNKHIIAATLLEHVHALAQTLRAVGVRVHIDADEHTTPGAKYYTWEMKGVPLRIEVGPRDIAAGQVIAVERIENTKVTVPVAQLAEQIPALLQDIQDRLFQRALQRRAQAWFLADDVHTFGPLMDTQPGFYQTGWCGSMACEQVFKQYKATTRCLIQEHKVPHCSVCREPSAQDVLVARAY